jgi:Protein of unknown function (DUF2934)
MAAERSKTPSRKKTERRETGTAPAHSAQSNGGPKRPEDMAGVPDEDAIRWRAYELWEADGRSSGRDEEYWHRAERELHQCKREPS